MKKILLLALLLPLASFCQSKFGITGSAGLFSIDERNSLNLNASLNYTLKEDAFTTGIEVFASGDKVNSEKIYTNQFFAYLEYGNPKWGYKPGNYFFSFIVGPGVISQKFDGSSVTEYSTLLATKFNIKAGKFSTFGLKTGFMFNKIDTCAFVNLFATYRF